MKLPIKSRSLALLLLIALAPGALVALPVPAATGGSDWPVERGDASGTGAVEGAVGDSLDVVWKYSVGEAGFEATPVVADAVVYVGDNEGTVHAVRLDAGKSAWTQKFAETGFLSAAAVHAGRLYLGDYSGVLHCLATADGTVRWSWNGAGEFYAGPNVFEQTLLITSEDGSLTALRLDTADGAELAPDERQVWQFRIDAPLRCAPTLAEARVLLAGCDSILHAVDAKTGAEVASLAIDSPTGSTPAIRGGRAYFGTEAGTFFAIELGTGDKPPTVAWTYADKQRRQGIRTAAAVSEKLVVYGSQGKMVYGLNPQDGSLKWRFPVKSRVESSPVIVGEKVVVATIKGRLFVLDGETGGVQWEYDAGGSFVAAPAVIEGRILIGNTDGTLYCFGRSIDSK